MTMAAVRFACDEWVAEFGRTDLPELIRRHLDSIEVVAHETLGA